MAARARLPPDGNVGIFITHPDDEDAQEVLRDARWGVIIIGPDADLAAAAAKYPSVFGTRQEDHCDGNLRGWDARFGPFFRLYGVDRDDVDYIMETFPIVKRKDVQQYGTFRTKSLILEIYDAMAEATRTGKPYQSILDPPPSHGSRHPADTREHR